jgi:hypothetical protein
MVDFNNSTFRITYTLSFPLKGNEPIIEVNSYFDFIQKEKELDSQGLLIRLDKYVINEEYKDKYDVYTFFPFDSGVFISKELRDVIVDNNLTGLKIIEVD